MANWIALLRGVNVGGRNKLPMKELASALTDLGLQDVATYIQSGNVVFRSPARSAAALEAQIADTIASGHGFRPEVLVIKADELEKAAAANPFPAAESEADGKALHLFLLGAMPASIDAEQLDAARQPGEAWALVGRAIYLQAPAGFHKSKLAAKVERATGVRATARNWRTISKLLEMVREREG